MNYRKEVKAIINLQTRENTGNSNIKQTVQAKVVDTWITGSQGEVNLRGE